MSVLAAMTRAIVAVHAGARRVVVPLATARGSDSLYWDDPIGRRRYHRIPLHGAAAEIHVAHGGTRTTVPVRMLDLSAGGARVVGAGLVGLERAALVRITVPLPNSRPVLGVPAVIVWIQHGLQGTTAGLEFRDIPPGDQRRIARAIDAAGAEGA